MYIISETAKSLNTLFLTDKAHILTLLFSCCLEEENCMYYYESDNHDPHYNLALEEYLFHKVNIDEELFMLWQNRPAIIIGKNQNTAEEVNMNYIKNNTVDIVRRMTGGGAVYHDLGNVNFTFISGASGENTFDFKGFLYPLLRVCARMNLDAEFTGRNDVTINGKKISGNSQHRNGNKLLHHGCILLKSDLTAATQALNVDHEKFSSKSIKSVRSRITNINDETETPATVRRFMDMLKEEVEIERNEKLQKLILKPNDLVNIEYLKKHKYDAWTWNYGKSPRYNKKVKKRFDSGTVMAQMMVFKGILSSIKFYGDFFGEADISELEKQLAGTHADRLTEKIENMDIEKYIKGVSGKELAALLNSND